MKNQNLKKLNEMELQEIVGGGMLSWITKCFGTGSAPVNPVEPVRTSSEVQVRERWYVPIQR